MEEDIGTPRAGMMFCKVCGAEIAKSAKACPHCGAKLKAGSGCLTSIFRFLIAPIILFILYWTWVQYTYHRAVEETMSAYTQAVEETVDSYTRAVDEAAQSYTNAVDEIANSFLGD